MAEVCFASLHQCFPGCLAPLGQALARSRSSQHFSSVVCHQFAFEQEHTA